MSAPFSADEAGVRRALEALGGTADEVAATLVRLGHRGMPCLSTSCPIADYLTDVLPARMLHVDEDDIEIAWRDRTSTYARTPQAVRDFIDDFDRGAKYQELQA